MTTRPSDPMRIALVSPYSWSYPGGVTRHVEALAAQLTERGHDVKVLAPDAPPGKLTARLHVGHHPADRPRPAHVTSLGRTVGVPSNGAVSNLVVNPAVMGRLKRELRPGAFDVVHLHEPVAPLVGWDALMVPGTPLVGTFHCYSEHAIPHAIGNLGGARLRLNHLAVRLAVSEAAAWTGRRFYGGEYRIVPNGVDLAGTPEELLLARGPRPDGAPLRLVFVGQAVERKGLPVLLAAFEALRAHLDVELTIIGAELEQLRPLVGDTAGIRALGRVDDTVKAAELRAADVLVAPSLQGESFGMVLTEAFAAGTPVVASDIAGYRDVVRHGVDGLLVPPGDAVALGERLRALALQPEERARLGVEAARSAQRFAWPLITDEVLEAYADARAMPAPATAVQRALRRRGLQQADGRPPIPAVRLASLEPNGRAGRPAGWKVAARRVGIGAAALAAIGGSVVGVERIGAHRIVDALLTSNPTWVLIALALMCSSMVVRAVAWRAILRAALPEATVRLRDVLRATSIGVLMSATLPARIGEPARAMVMAGNLPGAQPRRALGPVLGTIVSQTFLNLLALLALGTGVFLTSSYFDGRQSALTIVTIVPVALVLLVVVAPVLLRRAARASSWVVVRRAQAALAGVRSGLTVFRSLRFATQATSAQLLAWAVQWLSCYALLVAFGLGDHEALGAAAAVLFAVNVSAVLPVTPSNLGVFQAACVAVLTGAYGVGAPEALGYGIVLQAVEIATAIIMGAPALIAEGTSWGDMRMRMMAIAPVELPPLSSASSGVPGARST